MKKKADKLIFKWIKNFKMKTFDELKLHTKMVTEKKTKKKK